MPRSLIREAARRGKSEAERRDLQYKIDDAFHDEVEKIERKRQRKYRAAMVGRNLHIMMVQVGWLGFCVALAYNQAWRAIPDLRRFLWDKEFLAYIAMIFIFFYGRKLILQLLGVEEKS